MKEKRKLAWNIQEDIMNQGKPYYVYMTAGANKFLRIYYGRVKQYLLSLSISN